MNPLQLITTLRKFGNYLAGLFPFLVVICDFFTSRLQKVLEHPAIAPALKRLASNETAQSLWKFTERFYWRSYSKDRFDLQEANPESLNILKPILQLLALLCVLIPFTQYPASPVQIETFSGFKSVAPAWSVVMWLISLPCAWAALLIGAAVSNRVAFALTAVGATFFLSTCVVTLPRSYANCLLGVAVLLSLWFCERSLKATTKYSLILSLINCVIVGAAAGIQLLILSPLKPLLATYIHVSGALLGIGGGALGGIVLGLIMCAWARLPERKERIFFFRGMTPTMGVMVWSIVVLLLTYLIAGLARKDLSTSGGLIISSLSLSNNYLWPLWYFIGVGIIHKLLGSSKTIATAAVGFFPKKIIIPILLIALAAALLISLSEKIALSLASHPGPQVNAVLPAFYQIYLFAKPYIWSNPLNVMSIHWLTWVLVFDLAVVLALAMQKKLSAENLTRLFFMTVFAALLISEYVFQLSSFTRPAKESVTALFLFSVWLLWLMHTTGWNLSLKSSAGWPSKGRLALYCGVATLAILDIHARSACRDFKLTNELFLTMFRGVIEVGLPYFFLVWTSKKITYLPVRISTLLGMFSIGAIVSLTFNALGKLASAHWLFAGLLKIVNAQVDSLSNSGTANFDLNIPESWLVARAAIYIALLSIIGALTRQKLSNKAYARSTTLMILVAFASGIASFSETLVELPLPNELRALTAPLIQELTFNCNLLQSFLSFWIPALIIGIAQFSNRKPLPIIYIFASTLAAFANFYIAHLYVNNAVFMRATGLTYATMVMIIGLFIVLVTVALTLIKKDSGTEIPKQDLTSTNANVATLLTPQTLIVMVLITEVALIPYVIKQASTKFEPVPIQSLHHNLLLNPSWVQQATADGISPFTLTTLQRLVASDDSSVLQLALVQSDSKGPRALLRTLLQSAIASKRFPNFTLISAESWNKYAPDALSCKFAYQASVNGLTRTMAGLIILVPLASNKTECYTLYASPTNIEDEQWELAYAVQKLGAPP